MNTIATAGPLRTSASEAAGKACRVFASFAVALFALQVHATTPEPHGAQQPGTTQEQAANDGQIPAVWRPRELYFSYGSATSIYSCDALAGRVAGIMRAVGARDDVKVKVNDCSQSIAPSDPRMTDRTTNADRTFGMSSEVSSDRYLNRHADQHQFVHVYVHMMLPTAVTPEVLAELQKDKSRRELVAHVTGNQAARFNDPILFPAEWQPVTLSHKTVGLEPEDCELLDQMSSSVFRQMGLHLTHGSVSCSVNSNIAPEFKLDALVAAGAHEVRPLPAIGDRVKDPESSAPAAAPGGVPASGAPGNVPPAAAPSSAPAPAAPESSTAPPVAPATPPVDTPK